MRDGTLLVSSLRVVVVDEAGRSSDSENSKKKLIQSGTGAQFLGKSRGSSLTVARFFAAHHALSKYKVTYQSARQQQWGTGAQNHILNRDPTPRELTE